MKRTADLPPQCALNPQDVTGNNSHQQPPHQPRDDRNYFANRSPARNSFQRFPGQPKREPQRMSQPWSNPTYDNSNTSWEGDWSGTPPIKTDPAAFYKHPRSHPVSYQSGSEWSPGESSASSSVASSYGMVQSPNSNSQMVQSPNSNSQIVQSPNSNSQGEAGSYYENNGYYSSPGKNGSGGNTRPNYPPQQPYQQQPARVVDGYQHQPVRTVDGYQQQTVRIVDSYQQQTARTVEGYQQQMARTVEGYQQQTARMVEGYQQQTTRTIEGYQQQTTRTVDGYQQQTARTVESYQQQTSRTVEGYQQQTSRTVEGYQQHTVDSYQQQSARMIDGYQQQTARPVDGYHHQQPSRSVDSYQQHPSRMADGYQHHHHHHNNRSHPSICPTVVKPPMPEFQRRPNRYGMEGMPRMQVKQEPEEYQEMEGDNFTSLFTRSLTSLYSQETENSYPDDGSDPDIMILSPLVPPQPPPPPPPIQQLENHQMAYQRLHSSGGHYTTNTPAEYQDGHNSFAFYDNRVQNCDPPASVVQEIGGTKGGMNSFRYDRPSFDDMHLYAPSTADSKAQAKKRKPSTNAASSASSENFAENRKKASRMMSYKSESQWTPNSFGFDGVQVKQEPMDDYNSNELDTQMPFQDSPGSSGNGNSKTPEQPKDHPKQPPRKRSPGTTCFDRFDKKSTPTNKKVSPLSVYAKVQESIVLSVKCRRYKKRTKPISSKEEAASPGKEEMENYKRYSLTPDQAARHVMSELLDRVCLCGDRNTVGCPDLSQMDPYKLRELFMQFCHRSNLDFRDFEDVCSILRPRIVKDKMAKNSVRASAIRKRTSTSPVQASIEPPPAEDETKPPVVKTRGRRKRANLEDTTSAPLEKRVLRQLPGRAARNSGSPVVARRYSMRNSDLDFVIDLSTDREDEAGKEAEVRKKSQRSRSKRPARTAPVRDRSLEENKEPVANTSLKDKSKQPVGKKPARERSLDTGKPTGKANVRERSLENVSKSTKTNNADPFEDTRRRTRSREKKINAPKEIYELPPRKRRSCVRRSSSRRSCSNDSLWNSSVEIVDITGSNDSVSPPLLDAIKTEPLSPKSEVKTVNKNTKRGGRSKSKDAIKQEPLSPLKITETTKDEDVAEVEPPVLRRSVGRKRTKDTFGTEPPSLHKPAETAKRRNLGKIDPPSLPVSGEKIETKFEIKKEPLSPTDNGQKTNFEIFNGAIETEVAVSQRATDHSPVSSNCKSILKTKTEESPRNAAVKSGSSKRKQGGPTKFLKESFKTSTFPTFLESNSNPKNATLDVEQSSSKKFCNPNLPSTSSSSKLCNISAVALSESSANSSESLKERYRKSFCTEPLRTTATKYPKELDGKPVRFNPFLKSNDPIKHLKEGLVKTPVPKSEHSTSKQEDKCRGSNSSKSFTNFLNKSNSTSNFMVKVKEEPLSEEDTPIINHLQSPGKSKSTLLNATGSNLKTEKKPFEELRRRRSSQCSDSELQVVIKKLPDVHVDLRNGSVAEEQVRKCEKEQERMEQDLSDYDSDEEKPLFALKNSSLKQHKKTTYSESNCGPECHNLAASTNTLKNSTSEAVKPENPKNRRASNRRRYSDSEDSDCGLVIDLDRRLSVEELVPSSTFQNTNTDEDMTETEDFDASRPDESLNFASDKPQTTTTNRLLTSSASNSPFPVDPLALKVEDEPEPVETKHSSLFRDATEEAHILLELSRGGAPPLIQEVAGTSTGKWMNGSVEIPGGGSCQAKMEVCAEQSVAAKEPEKDESILRTLLLENGDAAPGTSQDMEAQPAPSTSSESKHVPNQDSMRLQPYQQFKANSSSERDQKKLLDELQLNSEKLSTDVNANLLNAYDWCLGDPQAIREEIETLKEEIRHLHNCRFKEEILKRLLKKYKANMKDPSEWSEQKPDARSHLNGHQPIALTSTPNGIHPRLSSALTGGPLVKSEPPSATVTSESNSGENLPTVATMVASATENYGVDLRTVTIRKPSTSSKTILQEALSSKEPIYRPVAIRSPLPQSAVDPLRVVQKSPLAAHESAYVPLRTCSPHLPELSRTSSHLSRRLLSPSSSQSPPSLQPELRQSSFTPVAHSSFRKQQPISLVMAPSETEATKTSHLSSPSLLHKAATPKCSPTSSPKSRSFNIWSKLEAEWNSPSDVASIDLRTNHGSPNFSQSRTVAAPRTNNISSHRSASVDPRANHMPSNVDMRASHMASNRSSSVDPRVNHVSMSTTIDLRTNQVSSNRPSSVDLRTNHVSSNHSNTVGLTNGHSSFMIVPPPTTLQSAFKERSHHRSRSQVHSSEKDNAMNGQMERIYERRNEEEPQSYPPHAPSPRFVPLAGPLMPIAPTSDLPKCMGCGISRGRYVCSGCERQLYCSAKCQSLRWAEHSKTCSTTDRKENPKSYN